MHGKQLPVLLKHRYIVFRKGTFNLHIPSKENTGVGGQGLLPYLDEKIAQSFIWDQGLFQIIFQFTAN